MKFFSRFSPAAAVPRSKPDAMISNMTNSVYFLSLMALPYMGYISVPFILIWIFKESSKMARTDVVSKVIFLGACPGLTIIIIATGRFLFLLGLLGGLHPGQAPRNITFDAMSVRAILFDSLNIHCERFSI